MKALFVIGAALLAGCATSGQDVAYDHHMICRERAPPGSYEYDRCRAHLERRDFGDRWIPCYIQGRPAQCREHS